MPERISFIKRHPKVAAAVLAPAVTWAAACNGGESKQDATEVVPIVGSPTRPLSVTATPTEQRTQPPVTFSPTQQTRETAIPTATSVPTAPQGGTDYAVRFGEAVGLQNNWIEVTPKESLQGLKEFTILARVKLEGVAPDAIVSKGEDVEAWAFFTSLATCNGLALVVDDDSYCSGLKVPRGEFVNVGVTLKDGKAKFFVGEFDQAEKDVRDGLPLEDGRVTIGASPKGTDEGFSGQIDDLVIVPRALSAEGVKEGFGMLSANTTKGLLVVHGDVAAMWVFDGNYEDLTGNGNNGTPMGEVSLVELR